MVITREMLVQKLYKKSGYIPNDIKTLLQCMDEVIIETLNEATLEDDIQIQTIIGIKLCCKILGERERVDPRTQEPIIVGETAKPFVKFSKDFKIKLQEAYDNKKDG